jgi:predicted enzyme related to lactoylglutathione lyase
MKLYRVIVPVSDIERATRFYSSVLGEPGRRVSDGRHYFGGPSTGGAVLACYSPRDDGDEPQYGEQWKPHPMQYVYIASDDLEAARARCIEAGARDVTDIEEMPWGETLFYAVDPFGNPISFVKSGTEFVGA